MRLVRNERKGQMRRILERKRAELEAWLQTLPQYADLGPDEERMSGYQEKKYHEALAQLKLLDELLGGPCWHETKTQVAGGYWQCKSCKGLWDHFPSDKEEPQFKNLDEVMVDLKSKIKEQTA
jgi:hypothetical protein